MSIRNIRKRDGREVVFDQQKIEQAIEAKIEEMPIGYAETVTPKYNEPICTELNITVPDGYVAIG